MPFSVKDPKLARLGRELVDLLGTKTKIPSLGLDKITKSIMRKLAKKKTGIKESRALRKILADRRK